MLLDPAIPDVRAAADRARAVFGGMRATRLLERLDAALAGPTDATAPLRSPAVTSMPAV
jgi:hypothetical protein